MMGLLEMSVDGETFGGLDEHQQADMIQRAIGRVDIEHFHLRSDCHSCMTLADLPPGPDAERAIRGHIMDAHRDEVWPQSE